MDAAGTGSANPLAMFLSAAMMLRHGLGLESEAAAVESAVQRALDGGLRTADLGGRDGTAQATGAVLDRLFEVASSAAKTSSSSRRRGCGSR